MTTQTIAELALADIQEQADQEMLAQLLPQAISKVDQIKGLLRECSDQERLEIFQDISFRCDNLELAKIKQEIDQLIKARSGELDSEQVKPLRATIQLDTNSSDIVCLVEHEGAMPMDRDWSVKVNDSIPEHGYTHIWRGLGKNYAEVFVNLGCKLAKEGYKVSAILACEPQHTFMLLRCESL